MRGRGQEKEREVLVLMLRLRLCSVSGLRCSAWHCPVEKHFHTLCSVLLVTELPVLIEPSLVNVMSGTINKLW